MSQETSSGSFTVAQVSNVQELEVAQTTTVVFGDPEVEDGLVSRTITKYVNKRVESIGDSAFRECDSLVEVDAPSVTAIGTQAFQYCYGLASVNFPLAESIGSYAFCDCKLTSARFPLAKLVEGGAFYGCLEMTTLELPAATELGIGAFSSCCSLTALVMSGKTLCNMANTSMFYKCYHVLGTVDSTYNPEGLKDGYIYVPDELVEDYKTETNWSVFASQIKPLSEYVEVNE